MVRIIRMRHQLGMTESTGAHVMMFGTNQEYHNLYPRQSPSYIL